MTEQEILENLYHLALAIYRHDNRFFPDMPDEYYENCQTIVALQEQNKAVLAVLITLFVKKVHTPGQDIRQHQAQLEGGFSGRGLDGRVITPFLREQQFPHMQSGSGWLTRSLEQARPYDLDYTGNIRPGTAKAAFLNLIDGVQCQSLSPEDVLIGILIGLIRFRDRNTNLVLSRPVHLSVAQVVDKVCRHHSSPMPGASRLPVLAMHAILSVLGRETGRYENCTVLPLEHHNTADTRIDLIGDVNINDVNDILFEGYEIKHNIPITSDLIQTSFEKLRTTPVQRFYILTTYPHLDYTEFEPDILRVAQEHGCQLIVNGVDQTLRYYLRIIGNTRDFVDAYVTNLETDPSITFQLKEAWNEIVAM